MNSFVTALSGASLNVILNLLMIPKFGAIGAAIATLASYGLVFVLRMIDAPRMIRFKLYLPRLGFNVVALLAVSAFMTWRPTGWLPLAILLTVLILAVNALPLLRSLKGILLGRRG